MARNKSTIRVNARLADAAKMHLGVKSRTEAVRIAVTDIVALGPSKALRGTKPRKFKILRTEK